jgi:starvation-inducible outer membrane lipoprotein
MRFIGLCAIGLWLGACSTAPIFPSETMHDVEGNTFDTKAWEQEAYDPSGTAFVPHTVELAGEIIRVLHNPDGVVILAEERPLDPHLASSPRTNGPADAPWFAVTFKGSVDPRLLQTGNQLFVVGTTYRAGPERFGGAPRVLPHLSARCLHLWNTEGVKNRYFYSETGDADPYPPEERTICLEDRTSQDPKNSSGGS